MFSFRRKAAGQRVVPFRPAAIEGLEGRCLLSGSPSSMGGLHVDNSGPSVKVPQQNQSGGKNTAVGQEIKGVVTAINGAMITVTPEHGGTPATFTIPSTATVQVKDSAGGLAAILPGAEITLDLSAADGSVLSLSAENPKANKQDNNDKQGAHIEGVVQLVNSPTAGTLTIIPEHGATPAVFTIPTTAKITINGAPAVLGAIAPGSFVEIHFAVDGTTVLSVEVTSAGV